MERRLLCRCRFIQPLAKAGLGITVIAAIHSLIVMVFTVIYSRYFLNFKGAGNEKPIAVPKGIVVFFGVLACITFLGEGAVMDWSGVLLTEVKIPSFRLQA